METEQIVYLVFECDSGEFHGVFETPEKAAEAINNCVVVFNDDLDDDDDGPLLTSDDFWIKEEKVR